MEYNKEYAKKVYAGLTKRGYTAAELGDEAKFVERMSKKSNRRKLYDYVQERGNANMGSWERFNSKMMEVAPQTVTAPQTHEVVPNDKSSYTFTAEEFGIGGGILTTLVILVIWYKLIKKAK